MTPVVPDVAEGKFGVGCDGDCLVADVEVASSWVGPNIGPQELGVEVVATDKGGEDM